MRLRCWPGLAVLGILAWCRCVFGDPPLGQAPAGKFGYGQISTPGGAPLDVGDFLTNETCAVCHDRQARELEGSMHSASHDDPLYRRFAEATRQEAGDKLYAFCSACHAPVGVAAGLIPSKPDAELPAEVKGGVSCDTCHQIAALTGGSGPWREEGNASFGFQTGRVRFGSTGEVVPNRLHTGEKKDFFAKSEFCASCHTVIHPTNGLRIENTYGEWRASIYAQKGIQCQDCHMASVEDAVQVAQTLQPVARMGQSANDGPQRRIHPHYFVGGNADADRLARGPDHAKMAEARLQSAAKVELTLPRNVPAGSQLQFEVAVHNIAAGHNLPTGVTELRQMWLEVRVSDRNGQTVHRSGQLDEQGHFPSGTLTFGAVAGDDTGKPTVKPWEMSRFLSKRTIPPKGVVRDKLTAEVPANVQGPLMVEVRLLYRSAPPEVVAWLFPDGSYSPKTTEMTRTKGTVGVGVAN
jgi:Cytochrome c554 and c-prime